MPVFDYAADGFAVREPIAANHRATWERIAHPGSRWTGAERVEIARQTRAAWAARIDPPWLREGLPEGAGLSQDALEVVRAIAADAHEIERSWAEAKIAALGDAAYVELGSIVVCVVAIDAFAAALGRRPEPLPAPVDGEPDGARLAEVADIGAFVPMMEPWQGPNVGRALSLVPEANAMFMGNVMSMYSSPKGGFYDLVWEGPLVRPQAELLAARVSAVNECFY